jgi:enamine deaminase RidA (YjgF/YER057c/UK114 family)
MKLGRARGLVVVMTISTAAACRRPDGQGARKNIASWGPYEKTAAYSRAVRVGDLVFVSGTTATVPGGHVGDGDAYTQSVQIFKNIAWALEQAGASLKDVVRTRYYVTDIKRDAEGVRRARREFLGNILPTAAMVEVRALADDWMLVEIEADAVVGAGSVR